MKQLYAFLLLAFCLATSASWAQSGLTHEVTLNVRSGQFYELETNGADAVGLRCESCVFDQAYIVVGQDTVRLEADEHSDVIVALAFLPTKPDKITFYSSTINGAVEFDFFKVGTAKAADRKTVTLRTGEGDCAPIEIVPTSVWRAGLAQPTYTPSFTQTEIIAVHHGASANISTYEQAVNTIRSYYLLHRNTNGWSDIGYNYLIGPEGSIFQGREVKATQTFTSDFIMGAHLCSKNVGTMGICMMGDFTNVLPTAKALESLYKLIKWKMAKDNLDVEGSTYHYGYTIPNIIGHREGPCATACPGDALYNYLFATNASKPTRKIKTEVGNVCNAPLGLTEEDMYYIVIVYPNPTNGQELKTNFAYSTMAIYSLTGQLVRPWAKKAGETISVANVKPGTYLFHFETPDYGKVIRRITVN